MHTWREKVERDRFARKAERKLGRESSKEERERERESVVDIGLFLAGFARNSNSLSGRERSIRTEMDRKRSKKKWRKEKRKNERVKVGHDDMMITLAPSSSRILTDDVSSKRERGERGRSKEMKEQGISHESGDIFATSGIGFSLFLASFHPFSLLLTGPPVAELFRELLPPIELFSQGKETRGKEK